MKHEFTDQQIDHAMGVSQEVTGDDYILEVSFEGIRTFLDALPEPQDDWIECAFEDIQKGDRVKWVYQDKDREQVITGIAHRLAYGDEAWVTESYAIIADISVEGQFYRIPAPVVHPDPDNNLVILVREVHGKTYDPPVVAVVRDSSTQNHPVYVYGDNGSAFPDYITDWCPAKVVADDE